MKRRSRAPRDINPAGTPDENLKALVACALNSGKFGRDLAFRASRWDVTGQTRERLGLLAGRRSVVFARELDEPAAGPPTAETTEGQGRPAPSPLGERAPCIGDYVRAYVRLMEDPSHCQMRMACAAGRFLARAMADHGVAEVAGITSQVFKTASNLVSAHYTKVAAHCVGYALESHARFLDDNGLTRASVARWRFTRLQSRQKTRKRAEAVSRSKSLLPSKKILKLVLLAYQAASHPADLIVTRVMALLLAAPERINEVLALGVNPEVKIRSPSGKPALGLRWAGSKRYPNGIKVIPTCMSATVRKSLEVLRKETEEGREIKAWYDVNPGKLYLPPAFEHLRGTGRLRAADVAALLGSSSVSRAHRTVRRLGIQQLSQERKRKASAAHNVSFEALEKCFLAMLPQQMRDAGGPEAKPLLVVRMRTFRHDPGGSFACMFEKVTYRRITCALMLSGTNVTVFQRLGLDPGRKASVCTKAFRHLLTTLVKRGGLSDTDLALWSGRKNTRNNHVYDHRTSVEMREGARRANPQSRRITSPLAREGGPGDDLELGA